MIAAGNENPGMTHEISEEAAKSVGSSSYRQKVGKSIDLYWLSDPTWEEINQGRGKEVEEEGKNWRERGWSCHLWWQQTEDHRWVSWSPMAEPRAGEDGAKAEETAREGRKAGAPPNRTKWPLKLHLSFLPNLECGSWDNYSGSFLCSERPH